MNYKKKEIAELFSNGKFDEVLDNIAEKCVWEIFGEKIISGKSEILINCKNTSEYFKSVETIFTTHNIIENSNAVSINGKAVFKKDGNITAIVNSCDVYEFNKNDEIEKIYSYCIYENK
ncbi:MAG TPA: hypothetical protein PLG90_08180 [Ignavibacteria bacterium]|nr:hypothetical protein [Ignavibacteria bacterium]